MVTVSRSFEIERPIETVWKTFADLDAWGTWFDFNAIVVNLQFKLRWAGPAEPGGRLAVEINGMRRPDWLVPEWDPPRRLRFTGGTPGADHFEMAFTFNSLTAVSTQVDFQTKIEVPDYGPLSRLLIPDSLITWKIDNVLKKADRQARSA